MISVQNATRFADRHFPEAPEKLAEHLRIDLRYSPMDGCDGWCLTLGNQAIIRINGRLSPTRRRFTLAHELAHLILGVPTTVGESLEDMLGSNSDEERRVNELASEILIPTRVVQELLPKLPVVAGALKKLAKKARVSELAAAIRVCNLAATIGLVNASVVLFDGDRVRWHWSKTLAMRTETAVNLLARSRETAPNAYRFGQNDGNVVVASTIENPYFGSATLFVQLLPANLGMTLSPHERRKELEGKLFKNNIRLQQQMSGLLGYHKMRTRTMNLDEAEADFWKRHQEKLKSTSINSKEGREYVRLRISEWL